jgi:hypothetical protein
MSAMIHRLVETPDAEFDRLAANDRPTRVLLRYLFEVENRTRALEGKPQLPEAVFRASLKQAFGQP